VVAVSLAGLGECTVFTGKINDRARITSIYARGDLFLFPSIYDTFGIVVREAAALRCPCLMIEGTNASQGIYDRENGFLCSNDVYSFASVISEIISNPKLAKIIGNNAMDTLPETWENVVDKAFIKYRQVIAGYKTAK
jgi:glycosyltransferase involved in cell wall biosynthesis